MLTYAPHALVREDRPSYRPFAATVVRVEKLTPSFRRVTFTGPDFWCFGTDRLDQRVKILFPLPGHGMTDVGADEGATDWYSRWRALPADRRNPFRTYTVRDVDPRRGHLVVDMVAHAHSGEQLGPASAWLQTAAPGDELVVVGPDARSLHSHSGIDWRPGDAQTYLLVGDETAVPAVCAILESLPTGTRAFAFLEVPTEGDVLPVRSAADTSITWVARDSAPEGIDPVVRAWVADNVDVLRPAIAPVRQELGDIDVDTDLLWDSPPAAHGRVYAWLAGEAALIKALRRLLVTDTGLDRAQVAFMGYWRRGRSEAQE
jgi:NADPH-dependent ferric siderophore reductase